MNRITYFIGIDVALEDFTAAILTTPGKPITVREQIPNTSDGFRSFEQWLKAHQITLPNSVVCLEATGVYGEALCYYLAAEGYRVAVEPPLKVKRAFPRHRRGSISPSADGSAFSGQLRSKRVGREVR